MKGQVNVRQRLIGLVGIIFSLSITSIGILLILFEKKPSGMLIVGSAMFLWIGLGFLGLVLVNMKTIILEGNKLTVGTFYGLIKKRYDMKELKSYNKKSLENGFGSYPGFLLKFSDGRQVHIHKMEFNNFTDFENKIRERATYDQNLMIEKWTPYSKFFVGCGGLIILLFIAVKSLGL